MYMMNPLHPISDDDLFQISFLDPSSLPIQTIPEGQILHDPVKDGSEVIGKGKQKQEQAPDYGKQKIICKDENKRWMHRETEKQRRQEMATLCASLRSLLPLEYIKGKRSASNHMYEAVKYIKHLNNKVKKLEAKRDELKKLRDLSPFGCESSGNSSTTCFPISVIVHPFKGGAEIMCSYSFRKYVLTQSQLLNILIKEGLHVVSCNFTKTANRFIHTFRFEDSDMAKSETDDSELQRKLTEAILSTSYSAEVVSEPEN